MVPGMEDFNPMLLLHGNETIEVFKPFDEDVETIT